MTTLIVPTLADLRDADDEAWDAYGRACHDPQATDETRAAVFRHALATTAAVMSLQRARG